ncbi:unnamed protein product [Adineta steineri]|uniref:PDZ domain-containing protein n=1 Tax=Adineta steineri TaxID=433720 RepID=A0A815T7V3_9BILA|nr:unnamed protein product [Adineta steineri]
MSTTLLHLASRLLARIRRLTPRFMKIVELEHQSGKLGISIEGGIGSEYFKGDHGVFITHIPNQTIRQLNIGDRLIEISSAKNTYDLRFVTHNEAKKRIGLACSHSQKIPPEICSLSGLRTLSLNEILQLNGNLLCSLPASFSYLTTLKQLNLSKNNFLTIPRAILYLTNLQVLDLSANRIQEINDDIEFLEVDELNLNNNQISQISTNISKCKRLKILRLDNNKLKLESIPTSLLKNCTVFQLSVNGNFFEETQFQLIEGYDDYERRYTANQRKRDATAILLLN